MLKSDGNGGYVIQKGTFALIMMVIALLSCVTTVVAYGVTMKSDIAGLQTEMERANIEHPQRQAEVEERLDGCEIKSLTNQERILAMQSDITEIKADVKELIKK